MWLCGWFSILTSMRVSAFSFSSLHKDRYSSRSNIFILLILVIEDKLETEFPLAELYGDRMLGEDEILL